MAQLNRTNLRQQTIALLRARILGGELEVDKVYSAIVLAGELGISATPVREAVLDLASDGLVEIVPNKGFRVVTPTKADLDEIAQLRLFLEVPVLETVVERVTDEQLKGLEDLFDACAAASDRGDVGDFLLADRAFHLRILETARNSRLTDLVMGLRDQTSLVGLKQLSDKGQLGEATDEHRRLLAALKRRDAKKAQEVMRLHLRHTRGVWAGYPES